VNARARGQTPYWAIRQSRVGGQGEGVKELQQLLIDELGPNILPRHKVDGMYGNETYAAVKALQKKLGFTGPAVDGLYGPKTHQAHQGGLKESLINENIYNRWQKIVKN